MHAKCYFNEDTMIISSMNMYENSERKNLEIGIKISRQLDKLLFTEAEKEFILKSVAIPDTKNNPSVKYQNYDQRKDKIEPPPKYERVKQPESILDSLKKVLVGSNSTGHCIRCRNNIPHDPIHPLCDDCYREWVKHKNREHPEHFCQWKTQNYLC